MATPQLSLGMTTFGPPPEGGWRAVVEVARAADRAGVDRLVISDHVVLGPHVDRYPWGRFPTGPDADWLEPLTLIAALAGATERVRFLTGVLVAPLRPAVLLAKQAATIDALSGGRLDLGVGVGWQPEEFAALGVDFARRGALLDEGLAACRALWAGGPVPVGDGDAATEVWCRPVPVQERLPVWFSGTLSGRNVRRIVELGDGWIPIMGATADDVASGTARLRAALADAGRDPGALQVRASPALVRGHDGLDLAATLAVVPELVAAGATDVNLPLRALPGAGDVATIGDACAAAVAALADAC
ncbi:MAG: TIGR03619 family F420-dependent LLM class oxidoreductase [Acidimicrobiales bacterium]